MAIGDDFEIQNDKDVRYIGAAHSASGAGYYTVLELHRWVQDLADNAAASGDDFMDMTKQTPSDKAFDTIINFINGFNIDDTAAEHLYNGSIIQTNGDEIYDGIQVIAGTGAHVELVQNGAIIVNDFWNSIPFGSSDKGLNSDPANGIASRFIVKVRTAAADIDGRRLIAQTREWGKTYSEFKINGTSRGINVAALTYADDLNNTTLEATVAGWTGITNVVEGYNGIDVNNDTTDEFFYSEWNRDTFTINQFYERMKWLTRRGSASTIYGLNGELIRGITHEISLSSGTGTWGTPEHEQVTWSGGTGRLLAVDNKTGSAATKLWIQVQTGVAPTTAQVITGTTSSATGTQTGAALERTLSAPFCGASTGSSIIGAYGFGIEALDLSSNDKVFDLTNTQFSPPNFVTFTVLGVVSTEDYVLVAPNDAGNIDFDQMTLNGALTGAAVTSVVVNGSIPTDTPNSGTIRILRVSGIYSRHPYSSFSGSTFTITSHDFSTDNAANGANVWISYIDKLATATSEAFTGVYASDRSLFIRVRDGGVTPIKTFETTGTLGSAGGSATANRTTDA
jgi:hypothetical protein